MLDKDYEKRRLQQQYEVFDEEGNSINKIVAEESFVKENFSNYTLLPVFRIPEKEKEWRNEKLRETDSLMRLPDYPYIVELEEYRQLLRDWPSTEDFPENRPVSFDEFLNPDESEEII